MVNILVNTDCPELVFPVASFLLGIEKEYYTEKYVIIPFSAENLNKDLSVFKAEFNKKMLKVINNKHFTEENCDQNQYVIFGIYPKNDFEAREIAFFFDKNSDNILGWFDNHPWPGNLLSFICSQSQKIKIDENKTFSQSLCCIKDVKPEWLEAEEAMAQKNINHPLAGRYLKSFLTLKNLSENDGNKNSEVENFVLFNSIVIELISGRENFGLSAGEEEFNHSLKKISRWAENFSDQHPLFSEAKRRGRSVGCLVLSQVEEYFDAQAVMEKGLEKFPWLCVLAYKIGRRNFVAYASKYLPINDMVNEQEAARFSFTKLLERLNQEVLKF